MNFRIYEIIPQALFQSISSKLIKENETHYFNLKLKNGKKAKVSIDHKKNNWYVNGNQIVNNDQLIKKNIPLIEQDLNFVYKPFVKIISESEKLQGSKFYELSGVAKKIISKQPRPNRMKSPGTEASLRREDRPICYGDCADIFKDKYGEEKGEKTYETLFINANNNFGWTVAANIQKEKAVMLAALGYERPNDLHDISYYPLWKEWIKAKVEKHKYHDFLKENKNQKTMNQKEKQLLEKEIRKIIKEEFSKNKQQNLDEGWKHWVIAGLITLGSFIPNSKDLLASTPGKLKPTISVVHDSDKPVWAKKDVWKEGNNVYFVGFAQNLDEQKALKLAQRDAQTKALLYKFKKLDPKVRYEPIPMQFNEDFYDYTETAGSDAKGTKVYVLAKVNLDDLQGKNLEAQK